jgi:hypothetical protein
MTMTIGWTGRLYVYEHPLGGTVSSAPPDSERDQLGVGLE